MDRRNLRVFTKNRTYIYEGRGTVETVVRLLKRRVKGILVSGSVTRNRETFYSANRVGR